MTLNLDAFDESSKKKSKTKYKAALGVGSVVSLFGIGSTLAANISLNGGGNVEFGQGVATTAACDEDGFSVTPVTSYDNDNSIFRIDYVQVEGVNLTPEGSIDTANPVEADFTGLGITDQNNSGEVNQADAKLQYPGQYFDGSDWKRTCDGVVIDFKAFTDDGDYALYTDDAYSNSSNTAITSPVGWSQDFDDGTSNLQMSYNPGFAFVIDASDDGSNYAVNHATEVVNFDSKHGWPENMSIWSTEDGPSWTTSDALIFFRTDYDEARPNAASVSKITVQSMSQFPASYYAYWNDLGNPADSVYTR
jgi:hypothetical protein